MRKCVLVSLLLVGLSAPSLQAQNLDTNKDPIMKNDFVELKLPKELALAPDSKALKQPVPAPEKIDGKLRPSPITWRLRVVEAAANGVFLHVHASNGASSSCRIFVRTKTNFD